MINDVVIVDAVRSPIGRRNGALSGMHPAELLAAVLEGLMARSGVDATEVGQVIGGCVTQVGEQAINVTRTAWLTAGFPVTIAATTVDAQCGSSQQATALAAAMVGSGAVEVAISCGTEAMSRVPLGASFTNEYGHPIPDRYKDRFEWTSQFEGAERIANQWGITRRDADEYGLLSQHRAARAWAEGHFDGQLVPIDAPVVDTDGVRNGARRRFDRDEGLRETSFEGLSKLKPVAGENGVHTAGSASQISDGASALLLMSADRADGLGLEAKARIVDASLVGSDPELMLTGPIEATRLLLRRNGMTLDDIDLIEINEAFASVVLAWERELGGDLERVNPNGGAISLGHPLGASGAALLAKAVHELNRSDRETALVTMCCGGGLGTGMLLRRV